MGRSGPATVEPVTWCFLALHLQPRAKHPVQGDAGCLRLEQVEAQRHTVRLSGECGCLVAGAGVGRCPLSCRVLLFGIASRIGRRVRMSPGGPVANALCFCWDTCVPGLPGPGMTEGPLPSQPRWSHFTPWSGTTFRRWSCSPLVPHP